MATQDEPNRNPQPPRPSTTPPLSQSLEDLKSHLAKISLPSSPLATLPLPASNYAENETLLNGISQEILRTSRVIKSPNFTAVTLHDLEHMADLYDEKVFGGALLGMARKFGLKFRWSRRMTSAGGKTTRFLHPPSFGRDHRTSYEITLSSTLLFQTFQDETRPVKVCGRVCRDRLSAMQRILEHELIHLLEMLVWTDSNCAASRFQGITRHLFSHTEHRHELITQRERASQQFNVKLGTRVRFDFEGKSLEGVVNRITRRATILVEDPAGQRFTNGKHYRKYYVPLPLLEPVSPATRPN